MKWLQTKCNGVSWKEGFSYIWLVAFKEFQFNLLLPSYKIITCNKRFLPSNNHVLPTVATQLKPQCDARLWAWLKSLCHIDRTEKKFKAKASLDHLALDPVLKGRTHLFVLISSTDFLLLSLLSCPLFSNWAMIWLIRHKIKIYPVSCHGSKWAAMATNDFRKLPDSIWAFLLDGWTADLIWALW